MKLLNLHIVTDKTLRRAIKEARQVQRDKDMDFLGQREKFNNKIIANLLAENTAYRARAGELKT